MTEQELQFQREYGERKAKRILRAAKYADVIARIPSNGSIIELRRSLRSKGYRSNYEPVPQYWAIEYKDGKPVYGRSLTEKAYQEAKAYALKHRNIHLP